MVQIIIDVSRLFRFKRHLNMADHCGSLKKQSSSHELMTLRNFETPCLFKEAKCYI